MNNLFEVIANLPTEQLLFIIINILSVVIFVLRYFIQRRNTMIRTTLLEDKITKIESALDDETMAVIQANLDRILGIKKKNDFVYENLSDETFQGDELLFDSNGVCIGRITDEA